MEKFIETVLAIVASFFFIIFIIVNMSSDSSNSFGGGYKTGFFYKWSCDTSIIVPHRKNFDHCPKPHVEPYRVLSRNEQCEYYNDRIRMNPGWKQSDLIKCD